MFWSTTCATPGGSTNAPSPPKQETLENLSPLEEMAQASPGVENKRD
jgi:hypothetical protein